MKVALMGYGAMGKLIAARAAAAGHEVTLTVTVDDRPAKAELINKLAAADVVIDFSSAEAVLDNIGVCMAARKPIVIGTTGWSMRLDEAKSIVQKAGGGMVFGANFSVGVNIFYRLTKLAAEMFAAAGTYESFIEEQHHSRKKDAPSGTALKLKQIVDAAAKADVSVASTRAGHIPGTHRVGFDSTVDQVLLTHTARSREGFADGAIVAAQWIVGKSGVYEFDQVMDGILNG